MDIQYLEISPGAAGELSAAIVRVYAAAFSQPPYLRGEPEALTFADVFSRQCSRAGFRCIVAREGPDGALVGFAYGFTSQPGQWWHDQVTLHLSDDQRERWLSDAFELTELAVLPSRQGQGIGGQLHDRVLLGLPHRTAVLSTMQVETPAMVLYRKRRWQVLLTNFLFSGAVRLYVILGKDLSPRQRD